MNCDELIEKLKKFPSDSLVGIPTGLGSSFKSISYVSFHKAHIMKDDEIIGETTLIHLHHMPEEPV